MYSPLQIAVVLFAITGIWCVWTFGLKKAILDIFREQLFKLRFDLFKLGESGQVPFDSDTYRSIEILFNGLIRFAHRLTAASLFVALFQSAKDRKDKNHVEFAKKMELKISRMPKSSQEALCEIVKKVNNAVWIYIVFTSFPLLLLCTFLALTKRFRDKRVSTREELYSAVEEEAYVQELRYPAMAPA
jgi:hypothetical protein